MFLEKQLNEIALLIAKAQMENSNVSKKGVDWHLDHSLKVLISIPKALHSSNPAEYRSNFNLIRTLIYTFNWIPRGKGKAPKNVRTFDPIAEEELIAQLDLAKKALSRIDELDKNSHFQHPYFGILNLKQAKKMMLLHTEHHLKICKEIVK